MCSRPCPLPGSSEAGEMESSVLECTARRPATGLGENVPLCVLRSLSVSVALVLGVDSQLFSCYGGTGCPECPEANSVPLPVPTSDRVSCVALPPFLLLHVYRSNSQNQAFEPLSAPVPFCQYFVSSPLLFVQHLVSSPPLSIVQVLL